MDSDTLTQILGFLQVIAKAIGVNPAILLGVAGATASNIILVNLLKALFPTVIANSRIPYLVAGVALVEAVGSAWHTPVTLNVVGGVGILGVALWASTIGAWTTAKIALHKVGTPASNPSGGAKP